MTAYRSLLERLATLAEHLPPSHTVGDRPAEKIASALIHYIEFGEKILDAADADVQHVADDLARSPDQRSVAPAVVGVLTEPFPTPRTVEEQAANQDAKLALLQAQVDALLAERLPEQTAAGAPIPQTEVSTTEPELPDHRPPTPEVQNTGFTAPTDLPAAASFGDGQPPQAGEPQIPADAPAPANPGRPAWRPGQ